MKRSLFAGAAMLAAVMLPAGASAEGTIKIGVIGGLSGSSALQGEEQLKAFYAAADFVNSERSVLDGKKIEIVPIDNKGNPQESLRVLKQAHLVIDRPAGNRRLYELDPAGIDSLRSYFEKFWTHALAAFKKAAEAHGHKEAE